MSAAMHSLPVSRGAIDDSGARVRELRASIQGASGAYRRAQRGAGGGSSGAGTVLGMFWPVLLGFSFGCMLWTLQRVTSVLPRAGEDGPRVEVHTALAARSPPPLEAAVEAQGGAGEVDPVQAALLRGMDGGLPPLPPGTADEPFKGRVGGGLQGGGPNWRYKLPLELSQKIKTQRELPKAVIRLAHNVIQEVKSGRRWERLGREWIELDVAAEEAHEKLAEEESHKTESRALTLSLKLQEEKQTRENKKLEEKRREEQRAAQKVQQEAHKVEVKKEKEKGLIKKTMTKANSKSAKLKELCATAVPGGSLAKTCAEWELPVLAEANATAADAAGVPTAAADSNSDAPADAAR